MGWLLGIYRFKYSVDGQPHSRANAHDSTQHNPVGDKCRSKERDCTNRERFLPAGGRDCLTKDGPPATECKRLGEEGREQGRRGQQGACRLDVIAQRIGEEQASLGKDGKREVKDRGICGRRAAALTVSSQSRAPDGESHDAIPQPGAYRQHIGLSQPPIVWPAPRCILAPHGRGFHWLLFLRDQATNLELLQGDHYITVLSRTTPAKLAIRLCCIDVRCENESAMFHHLCESRPSPSPKTTCQSDCRWGYVLTHPLPCHLSLSP